MKKSVFIIITVIGFLLSTFVGLFMAGVFKPQEPEITIVEDKNEQDPSKIKVSTERALFDIRVMDLKNNWTQTGVTSKNILSVEVAINKDNLSEISIILDEEGKKIFEKITSENIGKLIGLFLDDTIISSPTIREKITNGQIVISGTFTDEEAFSLKARLLGYSYKDIN